MPSITAARILILATHGYERSELRVPLEKLSAKGAKVKIASLEKARSRAGTKTTGAIRSMWT